MIRFVVAPDGQVFPDVDARAEGRGAWLILSKTVVAEAVRRKALERSLKQPARVPADLAELTQAQLEARLLGALGMARKAGQLELGAAKVASAGQKGLILGLFTASDASEDGRRKMRGLLRPRQDGHPARYFGFLSSGQMDLALGRDNVIHAALTDGPAGRSALMRAERLAKYLATE